MGIFTFFKQRKTERAQATELTFPLFCKVHAVKSSDHQGGIAQSRVGDKLLIVHTPTDERPFRAAVYSVELNRVLGFIEEELSEKLFRAFGGNFCRDGEVEQITGGPPYKYYGCNIRVMDTQDYVEEMEAFSAVSEED
ncbi:MAG: hypothetical protein E7371_06015 [Clostridiales bacterium]|nr:hypothetical protein [Clostridiales bacterium]